MTPSFAVNPYIEQFIDNLRRQYPHLWWPKFLFHYADILNIVRILEERTLYCRRLAKEKGLLETDSAGKDVISNTEPWLFDYARLYFRPRTPPLWHVEGFKPSDNSQIAHCPIPVYLLFDSQKVLSIPEVKYSNSNLASPTSDVFERTEDLSGLDFANIYHDTYLPSDEPEKKDKIIKQRCAEVIVHELLPLDGHLSWIVCRSYAERETLLNLLDLSLQRKYARITKVASQCFHCNAHYVEKVILQERRIELTFINRQPWHQFRYKYLFESGTGTIEKGYNKPMTIFEWKNPPGNYTLTLFINDHIAFKGRYQHLTVPF